MRLFLFAVFATASLCPRLASAGLSPLNRECDWVHERLDSQQRSCVDKNFDTYESTSWVDAANNEFHLFFSVLKFNPFGDGQGPFGGYYYKTDILTWSRLIVAKVCGASTKQLVQDFLGLKYYFRTLAQVLNPLYFVPKALSYVPRVGSFFKRIANFFETPYEKLSDLEKELYSKCEKSQKITEFFFQIVDFLWYVQMSAYIIDDIIIPASNMKICSDVNAKVKELISADGICHSSNSGQRQLHRQRHHQYVYSVSANSTETEQKRKFREAFEDRRLAFNTVMVAMEDINTAIKEFNAFVGSLQGTMDNIVDFLGSIVSEFMPFVDLLEDLGLIGILNKIGDVCKHIKCDIPIVCELDALFEDAVNAVLKAINLGPIDKYVDKLLEPLKELLPSLDVDVGNLDFLRISNAAEEAFEKIRDILNRTSELANLARSVFDPSIDAANALAEIDSGGNTTTNFVTSENGQNVTFTCAAKELPVVMTAQHTRYACTEDLSAYMRFPCGNSTGCTVTYASVILCPSTEPSGFSKFPSMSPDILHATYICFPSDRDVKELGIINDLQQYTLSVSNIEYGRVGRAFSIGKKSRQVTKWAQIPDAVCSLDRIIELDHWQSIPLPEIERSNSSWYFCESNWTGLCTQTLPNPTNHFYTDLAVELLDAKSRADLPHHVDTEDFNLTNPSDPVYEQWKLRDTTILWYAYCCGGDYSEKQCSPASGDCEFDSWCPGNCQQGCNEWIMQTWDAYIAFSPLVCGTKEPFDYDVRRAQYDFRTQVVDEYVSLFKNNVAACNAHIAACQGQESCDMSTCQRTAFDYACVFRPDFARQILTFAFTNSRSFEESTKRITCQSNRRVRLVKGEIGRGFVSMDVTVDQALNCSPTVCVVDPYFLADRAGLKNEVEPQTVRVETYCECEAGFEPEPLTNGTCVACQDGAYRKEGMSRCINCPAGTHSKTSRPLDDCVPCDKGTYNSESGSTECELCPAGTFNPNVGSTSDGACQKVPLSHVSLPNRSSYTECPPGYGNYPNDLTDCYFCGPGHVRAAGEASCMPCKPGSYSPGPSGSNCSATPLGTYQSQFGASGFVVAQEDHYVDSMNAVEPSKCPEGTFTGFKGAVSVSSCVAPAPFPDCGNFSTCGALLEALNVTDSVLGDGFCWGDPRWCVNTDLCGFDGGDCCPETCKAAQLQVEDNATDEIKEFADGFFSYSCHPSTLRCLAPRNFSALDCNGTKNAFDPVLDPYLDKNCTSTETLWGNGLCDPEQNFAKCNYDGGDCCMKTCKISALEGSCTVSTLKDCRDPNATVDTVKPALHGLPEKNLTVTAEEIPEWAQVTATDNDACFDGVVATSEEHRLQGCGGGLSIRRWNATDPSGNVVSFEQTIAVRPDVTPPEWYVFPSNVTVHILKQTSLHPDETGWPQVTKEYSMPVQLTWQDKFILSENGCGGMRYIERTWTAKDSCENAAERVQRIDVKIAALFGEAWNLQFTAVNGDLSVKHSQPVIEGAVGSSNNVKLDEVAVAAGGCAQAAAPYSVVSGASVSAKSCIFDVWSPRPIYYVDTVDLKRTSPQLTKQEQHFNWTSLASLMRSRSQKLAKARFWSGLFNGPFEQICEQVETVCSSFDSVAASETMGYVGTDVIPGECTKLVFSGSSPYWNVFQVNITDFLVRSSEGCIIWNFEVPSAAMLVINVRGRPVSASTSVSKSSKSCRSSKGDRQSFKPPIFNMGILQEEQILVNMPDVVNDRIHLEGGHTDDFAVLPFSLLAPRLNLSTRHLHIKGQVLVQTFTASQIRSSCAGLWWGNAACDEAGLKQDGVWGPWSDCEREESHATDCMRERTCSSPHAAFGGKKCTGEATKLCDCSIGGEHSHSKSHGHSRSHVHSGSQRNSSRSHSHHYHRHSNRSRTQET